MRLGARSAMVCSAAQPGRSSRSTSASEPGECVGRRTPTNSMDTSIAAISTRIAVPPGAAAPPPEPAAEPPAGAVAGAGGMGLMVGVELAWSGARVAVDAADGNVRGSAGAAVAAHVACTGRAEVGVEAVGCCVRRLLGRAPTEAAGSCSRIGAGRPVTGRRATTGVTRRDRRVSPVVDAGAATDNEPEWERGLGIGGAPAT